LNKRDVFVKHLTQFEAFEIRQHYNLALEDAKKNGILPEADQVVLSIERGWWSKAKESQIASMKNSLSRLTQTKAKLIYESDKKRIVEQIKEQEIMLAKLQKERASYIIMTGEEWASQRTVDSFVLNFMFYDKDMREKVFPSKELFELAEDSDIDTCSVLYYRFLSDFNPDDVKKLALSPYFQNLLYVSKGIAWDFYGKSAISLTKNQADFLVWGKYYQTIIRNADSDIPQSLFDDPDGLTEWFEDKQNQKKASSHAASNPAPKDGGSTFLFGNRDEVKAIAGEISGDRVLQEAKEKKGLSMHELMER
jgi:hypothetical protein